MFLETSFDFLLFFSFCITQTQFAFVLFKGKKLGGENLSLVVEKSDKKNEELFKSEKINSQNKNYHSNQKSYFITK